MSSSDDDDELIDRLPPHLRNKAIDALYGEEGDEVSRDRFKVLAPREVQTAYWILLAASFAFGVAMMPVAVLVGLYLTPLAGIGLAMLSALPFTALVVMWLYIQAATDSDAIEYLEDE